MRTTLRTRIAALESLISWAWTPDADRAQLLLDHAALLRVLARGGR